MTKSIVILCGGKATRLKGIAKSTPKSLLKVGKKIFIDLQIDYFAKSGINKFYFCLSHMGKMIEEHIQNNYRNLDVCFSYDDESYSGTGGAVKKVSKIIEEPFFVTYGDSLLNINLKQMYRNYIRDKGPMISILKNHNNYDSSNCKIVDNKLSYSKFSNDPDFNFIDYGIGIYQTQHFSKFQKKFDLAEVLEKYSKEKTLQYYIAEKRFYEIGSISGLQELDKIYSAK